MLKEPILTFFSSGVYIQMRVEMYRNKFRIFENFLRIFTNICG